MFIKDLYKGFKLLNTKQKIVAILYAYAIIPMIYLEYRKMKKFHLI